MIHTDNFGFWFPGESTVILTMKAGWPVINPVTGSRMSLQYYNARRSVAIAETLEEKQKAALAIETEAESQEKPDDFASPTSSKPLQSISPTINKINPSSSNLHPTSSRLNPSSSNLRSTSNRVNPSSSNLRSTSNRVNPSSSNLRSTSSRVNASKGNASTKPHAFSSNVHPASSKLHPPSSKLHPSNSNLHPPSSKLHPSNSNLHPPSSKPQSSNSKLVPASSKPVSGSSRPVSPSNRPIPASNKTIPTSNKPVSASNKSALAQPSRKGSDKGLDGVTRETGPTQHSPIGSDRDLDNDLRDPGSMKHSSIGSDKGLDNDTREPEHMQPDLTGSDASPEGVGPDIRKLESDGTSNNRSSLQQPCGTAIPDRPSEPPGTDTCGLDATPQRLGMRQRKPGATLCSPESCNSSKDASEMPVGANIITTVPGKKHIGGKASDAGVKSGASATRKTASGTKRNPTDTSQSCSIVAKGEPKNYVPQQAIIRTTRKLGDMTGLSRRVKESIKEANRFNRVEEPETNVPHILDQALDRSLSSDSVSSQSNQLRVDSINQLQKSHSPDSQTDNLLDAIRLREINSGPWWERSKRVPTRKSSLSGTGTNSVNGTCEEKKGKDEGSDENQHLRVTSCTHPRKSGCKSEELQSPHTELKIKPPTCPTSSDAQSNLPHNDENIKTTGRALQLSSVKPGLSKRLPTRQRDAKSKRLQGQINKLNAHRLKVQGKKRQAGSPEKETKPHDVTSSQPSSDCSKCQRDPR